MIPVIHCAGLDEVARFIGTASQESQDSRKELSQTVETIIQSVRTQGESALREMAVKFGDTAPESFLLSSDAVQAAIGRVPEETRRVIQQAAHNISRFGTAVVQSLQPVRVEHTIPGSEFLVGLDYKPVESVACYVPGGRFPLPSTALMTAMTAKVAGVPNICIVSPKLKDEVIYAGSLSCVTRFYNIGGAQAVAALAYGTETINAVDMIVGPGNAYVTEAKRQLQGKVGIDMLAGPSEVAIIADDSANPQWIALDLLAQAEHDPDARVYLLTPSAELANAVFDEINHQQLLINLPEFIHQSLLASALFVLPDLSTCIEVSNFLAPEHLEIQIDNPQDIKSQLTHYGALFMGHQATVAFGDYLSGPNHTLPTGRTARFTGGLSPLTFLRPQSWFQPTGDINQLIADTHYFASFEGLNAHAAAAKARNP